MAGRRLPAAIYALGLTSLLNDAASEMIYPLLPVFLSATLGASAVTLGIIEGAAESTASLLKLASGILSDRRRSRKPFVVVGYAIASIARPLVGFARSAGAVLAVRIVDRIGKGVRTSPRDALIADLAPKEMLGRAFGVHEAMDNAGAVVGPLLAFALLAAGVGLRSVFLLAAIPAVAALAVVAFVVREPERPTPAPAAGLRPGGPPFAPSRPFVAYLAAVTLFTLGNSSDAFLLLRAHHAGLPVEAAPLLWALHNAVKAVVTGWGGGLADRIGRRRALAAGWVVYAGIYAGFAVARSAAAIVALFVLYALYFALVGGAQKALVAELVPIEARARGFGVYHLCIGLAALPASALFGLLYQRHGAPAAFGTGAALSLLAAFALPLSRPRPEAGV